MEERSGKSGLKSAKHLGKPGVGQQRIDMQRCVCAARPHEYPVKWRARGGRQLVEEIRRPTRYSDVVHELWQLAIE